MLPTWESDPVEAAKNDQSFATASDLSVNASLHRRGSLLSSLALGTNFGLGSNRQSESKQNTSGFPPRSFHPGQSSSNSQRSSSRSVTSTVSSGSHNSNTSIGVNDGDLGNAYFSTIADDPPASSYIGEQHFWDNQKSRLQATDQQLAVTNAIRGGGGYGESGGGGLEEEIDFRKKATPPSKKCSSRKKKKNRIDGNPRVGRSGNM